MSLELNEPMVLAKTRSQDLRSVVKLNFWSSGIKDVSLVRKLVNVEVIGLSCNEVTTLEDFAHCPKLKELILRQNKIKNLSEIEHLRNLQNLKSLWLGENPCAQVPNYRKEVLRVLPNLKTLDNIPVTREELKNLDCPDPEVYSEETTTDDVKSLPNQVNSATPSNKGSQNMKPEFECIDQDTSYQNINDIGFIQSNESNEFSIQSNNGASLGHLNEGQPLRSYQNRTSGLMSQQSRSVSSQGAHNQSWSGAPSNLNNNVLLPKGGKSRPANILSAVLCLVKELDYVSCEVVQTALHCRMEETCEASVNFKS